MAPKTLPQPILEIEVTPEMLEAGATIFYGYDPGVESGRDIVDDIFRAMLRASPALHTVRVVARE